MPKRFKPDDPREWLNRARSNLARAKSKIRKAYLEDLCFDAQQAAEKAIKAVLIRKNIKFPFVHDIGLLLNLLEKLDETIPDEVYDAEVLTQYAVVTRYPGTAEPVTEKAYRKAVKQAENVVNWADKIING